jgi:AraC-like DNA-binding protein
MSISSRYDEDIVRIFTEHVLPWWQRHGPNHLVKTASTLAEFKAQPLPPSIRLSVKKRRGRKVAVRGPRLFDNTSFKVATWPEDGQETLRYHALACVLRGHADFHIADYVVHCPEGHFVLFAANVPQPDGKMPHFADTNDPQNYCEVLWLLVPPWTTNRISSWICYSQGDRHWIKQLFDYCLIERSDVTTFFNTFIREVIEQPAGYREMAHISLNAFLLLFIRELQEGRFSPVPSAPGEPRHGEARIACECHSDAMRLAVNYINQHLNHSLTTLGVSEAIYMSRSNFIRRFQREIGQSFNGYVTAQRLEEATRLLIEENLTVDVICRLVGLSSSQLRHLFHKHYGVSPTEFAARQRQRHNTGDQ